MQSTQTAATCAMQRSVSGTPVRKGSSYQNESHLKRNRHPWCLGRGTCARFSRRGSAARTGVLLASNSIGGRPPLRLYAYHVGRDDASPVWNHLGGRWIGEMRYSGCAFRLTLLCACPPIVLQNTSQSDYGPSCLLRRHVHHTRPTVLDVRFSVLLIPMHG